MIEALDAENHVLKNKISGMVPRPRSTNEVKGQSAAKGKDISPDGSLSRKELEELLLERTEALEECNEDLDALK